MVYDQIFQNWPAYVVCIQWEVTLLLPVNCFTNELTIHVCTTTNSLLVCFLLGLTSEACLACISVQMVLNGTCGTGQTVAWLEITIWLASMNWLFLWYLVFNQALNQTIYLAVFILYRLETLPLHGFPPPPLSTLIQIHVVLITLVEKLSKIQLVAPRTTWITIHRLVDICV